MVEAFWLLLLAGVPGWRSPAGEQAKLHRRFVSMGTRVRLGAMAALVLAFGVSGGVLAEGIGGVGKPSGSMNRSGSKKNSRYYVCCVKSVAGEVTFEVLSQDKYGERRKECPKLYKDAVTEWTNARKQALKSKEKFADPRPVKPSVTKVGRTFKKEDEAKEYASKLQERYDKKKDQGTRKQEDKGKKADE